MSLQPLPRMRLIQEGSMGSFQPGGGPVPVPERKKFPPKRPPARKRKSAPSAPTSKASEPKIRRGSDCLYNNRNYSPQPLPAQQQQQHRRRTADDFLTFCKMILDYENYNEQDDARKRHSSSPLGSTGSSTGSSWDASGVSPKDEVVPSPMAVGAGGLGLGSPGKMNTMAAAAAAADTGDDEEEVIDDMEEYDEDAWKQVTCFCNKPYAGRPMIECTGCLTWVHLKCAKLNRNRIPEHWFCHKCRPAKQKPNAKSKASPAKNRVSGSRKRKSSVTSKRVVKEEEAPSPGDRCEQQTSDVMIKASPPQATSTTTSTSSSATPSSSSSTAPTAKDANDVEPPRTKEELVTVDTKEEVRVGEVKEEQPQQS